MEKPRFREWTLVASWALTALASLGAEPPEDADFSADSSAPGQKKPAQPREEGATKDAAVANLFRIPGAQAVEVARAAGYCFSPNNGKVPRDGRHTTASQFANIATSEVDGARMSQSRPPEGWSAPKISNIFYMFTDSRLRPAPLAPGWTIRGIQLKGPAWQWVGRPAAGAPSASFAISIYGYKSSPSATVVELTSISLVGPAGAKDWRAAFAPLPRGRERSK